MFTSESEVVFFFYWNATVPPSTFYLAELFCQATFYLAELFHQATFYLAELFRQIAFSLFFKKKNLDFWGFEPQFLIKFFLLYKFLLYV